MEVFVFARFHALEGREAALAEALREDLLAALDDPGCLARCLSFHSRPAAVLDPFALARPAAFDAHAEMPHTVRFIAKIGSLIGHPLDVTRTHALI